MIVIDDNLGNNLMTTPFSRNDILDDIVTLAVVAMHPDRYMDDDGGCGARSGASTPTLAAAGDDEPQPISLLAQPRR